MMNLCSCKDCGCHSKCDCMQTKIKTQIILFLHQKQRKRKGQLANKPKYIKVQPSLSNLKLKSLQQSNIQDISIRKLGSNEVKRGKKLSQTNKSSLSQQSYHQKRTSVFTNKFSQNQNPNSQNNTCRITPKTSNKNFKNQTVRVTPKFTQELQSRLVDQDNQHLKKQLLRLKKQQRQLLTVQKQMKNKFQFQIKSLISNSQDLRNRSSQRKKQISQLKEMLQWKKTVNSIKIKKFQDSESNCYESLYNTQY